MSIDQFEPTGLSTSSGNVSTNTPKYSGVDLRNIFVKFTTNKVTFRLQIVDRKDREIYDRSGLESPYREQISLLLRDINTVRITEASEDEAVEILFKIKESA